LKGEIVNKVKTIEHGGYIYGIAQSDTNRIRRLINNIHCWLIKKLVSKKPVIMNVRFTDKRIEAGEGAFVFGCVFKLGGPGVFLELGDT